MGGLCARGDAVQKYKLDDASSSNEPSGSEPRVSVHGTQSVVSIQPATFLRATPLSVFLNSSQLDRLGAACDLVYFDEGEVMFREGEEATTLLLVVQGEACLYTQRVVFSALASEATAAGTSLQLASPLSPASSTRQVAAVSAESEGSGVDAGTKSTSETRDYARRLDLLEQASRRKLIAAASRSSIAPTLEPSELNAAFAEFAPLQRVLSTASERRTGNRNHLSVIREAGSAGDGLGSGNHKRVLSSPVSVTPADPDDPARRDTGGEIGERRRVGVKRRLSNSFSGSPSISVKTDQVARDSDAPRNSSSVVPSERASVKAPLLVREGGEPASPSQAAREGSSTETSPITAPRELKSEGGEPQPSSPTAAATLPGAPEPQGDSGSGGGASSGENGSPGDDGDADKSRAPRPLHLLARAATARDMGQSANGSASVGATRESQPVTPRSGSGSAVAPWPEPPSAGAANSSATQTQRSKRNTASSGAAAELLAQQHEHGVTSLLARPKAKVAKRRASVVGEDYAVHGKHGGLLCTKVAGEFTGFGFGHGVLLGLGAPAWKGSREPDAESTWPHWSHAETAACFERDTYRQAFGKHTTTSIAGRPTYCFALTRKKLREALEAMPDLEKPLRTALGDLAVECLHGLSFTRDCDLVTLHQLFQALRFIPLRKDEVLFSEFEIAEPANSLYLLFRGSVAASLRDFEGQQIRVAELSDGTIFGELGLLFHTPRTITVTGLAPTILLELAATDFRRFLSLVPRSASVLRACVLEYALSLHHLAHNNAALSLYTAHLMQEHSEENILFWIEAERFRTGAVVVKPGETEAAVLERAATYIVDRFIKTTGEYAINIESSLRRAIVTAWSQRDIHRGMFVEAEREVYKLMDSDSFLRFKKGQAFAKLIVDMHLSGAKRAEATVPAATASTA